MMELIASIKLKLTELEAYRDCSDSFFETQAEIRSLLKKLEEALTK